ncbi:hypothetical protein ACFQ4N_15760 [Oceanobacillus iheyensis]|uniref:Uncharacterized protein n=1 Tax=Oceanobacillus iheyensis (strain DSM 14371 / CIP 107618 / JCM 11309 / KCTC 3954 / HTE831) TaxID=221109 RepID=Q8ELD6_OCEIH|nr:hypothetical protein [Oceanobacillus iheyensis]BAC15249.1 hypothetical protein [Oceanobacillus iheyensis HTE831]
MSKKVSFKESRIFITTFLLLGTGFLTSAVPEGSLQIMTFNLLLALVAGVLFYYFWKKTKHKSKRYFSLLSYVMLNVMAIQLAIPLLRIYFLTLTFWIGVGMLIIMMTVPYFTSRKIAISIQKPGKSKLGKLYLLYVALVFLFGGSAYTNSIYTSNPDAIVIAVLGLLFSLLFLFVAPVLLIKPAEMDELTK